jgi:excisionase family DNA binding protein
MKQLILNGVEYSQLLDDVRAVVRHEMRESLPPAAPPAEAEAELLTIKEAAQLLDVCVATIHEYKRTGVLPFHKLRGRTYLKRTDVVSSLRSHQRTPKTNQTAYKRKA